MTTKKSKSKKATGATQWSLTECALAYLESLKAAKKSESTLNAYSADLDIAVGFLGGDTDIATIGFDQIQAFNASSQVVTTKSGRPKALPTVERSRRVLRLALCHAEREGVIERAPFESKRRETKPVEQAPALTPTKPKRAKKSAAATEPSVGSEEWKQAQRELPLHQREAIGLDEQRDKPAAADDDPAQITYAGTGESVSA